MALIGIGIDIFRHAPESRPLLLRSKSSNEILAEDGNAGGLRLLGRLSINLSSSSGISSASARSRLPPFS